MAKKGRDLFEVLRERTGGSRPRPAEARGRKPDLGSPARKAPAPPSRGVGGGELASVGRGVAEWFKRKVGATPPPAPEPRLGQTGIVLAAVAMGALLMGFVVGRMSSASGDSAGGLRLDATPERGSPGGVTPAGLSDGADVAPDAISRDRTLEEKVLSTEGYCLLTYPALDRQKAANVATWLRANGLPDTRLKSLLDTVENSYWIAVICYTSSAAQAEASLRVLRTLRAPDFAPELVDALLQVQQLTGPQDVRF